MQPPQATAVDDRAEVAQSRLEEAHPTAAALDLRVEHLYGDTLEALSFAQLDALHGIHSSELERIEARRMELVRMQERDRVREEFVREEFVRARLNSAVV